MDGVASEQAKQGVADAELLAGMRAGNSAAFAALMRSNNQRLYRLAHGFLRDDLEAEEAVHDGYVRAFTHLDGFRGGSSLATWLARIVSNEALGRLRRRPTVDISEVEETLAAGAGPLPQQSPLRSKQLPDGRSATPSRKRSTSCRLISVVCSCCAPSNR